ncbi:MAG: hypothetical protein HMLKMBBP_03447 [Planctomycetes bacterium]|nr:hypothetical protein [Planctomycetota bacterium]
MAAQHAWKFSRMGGFDQVRLDTAEDLKNLEHLDLKLWAALACPVKGLEMDERTLALIDTDGDGRVRAREVIEAVQWCEDHLKDVGALKQGGDSVPLAQINDQTDSGKAILASARRILSDLGRGDATSISLADVSDTAAYFAQTKFNGDGIVPAEAASDDATKAAIADVIACMGAAADRSGKPGVNQANVDAFFAQCQAYSDWSKKGADAAVSPLGGGTGAALAAVNAVRAKVDDYFARCAMAAFDARSLSAVNRKEEEYLAVAAKDLSITAQEIAGFPMSRIEAGRPLSLTDGVNPAWAGAVAALRTAAVEPALGKGKASLTQAEWAQVCEKVAPHAAWLASKPATAVEKLGGARIDELLASGAQARIGALVAQDAALAKEFEAIGQVERLCRYYRDLYRLLSNFVNFQDFYSRKHKATFQAGTLYLDQRACDLAVRVNDAGKHGAMAGMSKCYLAYCDLTRPSGESMQIAAAFTGGDNDYLMVGRNGIFYDRKGRDWDATITKVIDNPISIRQAFWSPYKKFVRMIEEQVAKRAAAADAEADARVAAAATATANADKNAPGQPAKEPKKIDVGTVAALGVAFGAIGTLLGMLIGGLSSLFSTNPFWVICIALFGIMMLISGPAMLIAWLKLRQRNLAPILDANGWAVNGRVKMNVPFGGSLTSVAETPLGSVPADADPFAEKRSPWPGIIKWVVILGFVWSFCNHQGWIYDLSHKLSDGKFTLGTSKSDRLAAEKAAEAKAALEKAADEKK